MQFVINNGPASWIPGEFANTNPRVVYTAPAAAGAVFGHGGKIKDGKVVKADDDATGIVMSTHQHVAANGPVDGYAATLEAIDGDTVDLCSMGDVLVKFDTKITTLTGSDPEALQDDFKTKWNAASPVSEGKFCGLDAQDISGFFVLNNVPKYTMFFKEDGSALIDGVEKVEKVAPIRIG